MNTKLKRRLALLDDMLDFCLRSSCKFMFCNGPKAPIKHMKTCSRCACIHRAIQMKLVKEVKESYAYVRTSESLNENYIVNKGTLLQFSAIDGELIF